ncbi:hypothetical protein [Bradyrhizobium centrosematis]|uniref:hypothetical protein n=1 Tax=Bradyrhizobium centrosematis TaxID=1300039 RepID=UPI00388F55D9
MSDLVVQKSFAPARPLAGPALFRLSGRHMQATRKQMPFSEAGQQVQRQAATLRETASVATQWNGH